MLRHHTQRRSRRGFTLVELLVVIAIIGVLVATNMQGVPYTTPIYETNAQVAIPLPVGSSLINTPGMTIDKLGQPVLATWWAPNAALGDHRRQYMLAWYDNS